MYNIWPGCHMYVTLQSRTSLPLLVGAISHWPALRLWSDSDYLK